MGGSSVDFHPNYIHHIFSQVKNNDVVTNNNIVHDNVEYVSISGVQSEVHAYPLLHTLLSNDSKGLGNVQTIVSHNQASQSLPRSNMHILNSKRSGFNLIDSVSTQIQNSPEIIVVDSDHSISTQIIDSEEDLVDSYDETLLKQGFSQSVIDRIKAPQRKSTRCMYDGQMKVFQNWSKANGFSRKKPTIAQIAGFFQYLFETLHRRPGTIRNYKSALVDKYPDLANEIRASDILKKLLQSFFTEKPNNSDYVNPWDLTIVLDALKKEPFEPLKDASLKYLTLKTVFLITLASGRRRSEVHAFAFRDVKWNKNNSEAILPVHVGFLAKNQKAKDGFLANKPIIIKSLSHGLSNEQALSSDRLLCPIRALKFYLQRTSKLRMGKECLFISYQRNRESDIHTNTISGWLKQVISFAYSSSNRPVPKGVKAHQLRSVSSSWAHVGGVSLPDLMEACFWKSKNSFISYYFKDCWTNASHRSSIGPVVVAGSVVE